MNRETLKKLIISPEHIAEVMKKRHIEKVMELTKKRNELMEKYR